MMPGITVERKQAVTDRFAPHATTMHRPLGGISMPRGAEQQETAAAISGGYFFAFIFGIMIEPMQERVAIPLPQIAPNTALDIAVMIARLPLI